MTFIRAVFVLTMLVFSSGIAEAACTSSPAQIQADIDADIRPGISGGILANTLQGLLDLIVNCYVPSSGSGLTVGSTTIAGGTNGNIEYNNAGVLGEKATTGTGSVVLSASPTFSGTIGGSNVVPFAAMPALSANGVLGQVSAGVPTPLPMPTSGVSGCAGANQALNWTSGTGFGCATISGGGGGGFTLGGWYDLIAQGCSLSTSTASADQAPCIQTVLNAAHSYGGGVVWADAGSWNLKSQIVIPSDVALLCAGNPEWYDATNVSYASTTGTILQVLWGSGAQTAANAAIQLRARSKIDSCGFNYPNQTFASPTPTIYGSTILLYDASVNGNMSQSVTNNFCGNCYAFIDARGSVSGTGVFSNTIYNNKGAPIAYGIMANNYADWGIFDGNHFNSGRRSPNRASTFTSASGTTITLDYNGFSIGDSIEFYPGNGGFPSLGSLPSGITAGTSYYVVASTPGASGTISVSTTSGGGAISVGTGITGTNIAAASQLVWSSAFGVAYELEQGGWYNFNNNAAWGYGICVQVDFSTSLLATTFDGPIYWAHGQCDATLEGVFFNSGTPGTSTTLNMRIDGSTFTGYDYYTGQNGSAVAVATGAGFNSLQMVGNYVFGPTNFVFWAGNSTATQIQRFIINNNAALTTVSASLAPVNVGTISDSVIGKVSDNDWQGFGVGNLGGGVQSSGSTTSTNLIIQYNQF